MAVSQITGSAAEPLSELVAVLQAANTNASAATAALVAATAALATIDGGSAA